MSPNNAETPAPPYTTGPGYDADAERLWLEAEWRGLAEIEREHPGASTDAWPARIRVDAAARGRRAPAAVEVFCVCTWHAGDEQALHCADRRTDDAPFAWLETEEKTLAALPAEVRMAFKRIEVGRDLPNPEPGLRWRSRMRGEEEYAAQDPWSGEAAADGHEGVGINEEQLAMDCDGAVDYGPGPLIPDGCDMDAAADAGFNHVAVWTARGNLWELRSLDGIILWDDYRAS